MAFEITDGHKSFDDPSIKNQDVLPLLESLEILSHHVRNPTFPRLSGFEGGQVSHMKRSHGQRDDQHPTQSSLLSLSERR